MDPEAASTDGITFSRRHSSVVSMPMSRRSTDSFLAARLSAVGFDTTIHMAAAVAAAVAATDSRAVGPQLSSSAAAIGGSTVNSTDDHAVGQGSLLRRDRQQQNDVRVTGPCPVVGGSDAVLSASSRQLHTTDTYMTYE